MAVIRSDSSILDPTTIQETSTLNSSEELTKNYSSSSSSTTRDLLKKAKEAANQKFAETISSGNNNNNNNNKEYNSNNTIDVLKPPLVLRGSESPAWHGQLIKTTLKQQQQQKPIPQKPAKPFKPSNSILPSERNIASRSLFQFYTAVRKEFEDFREIEAVRLQRRLEKLSDFPMYGSKIGDYEKDIVPWQSDSSAQSCFVCIELFTVLNRRHHCRLCGRVICSGCLKKIPLKLVDGIIRQTKSCIKCHTILFKKQPEGFNCVLVPDKMISLHRSIKNLKDQLLETIPKFNEYLLEESVTMARPLKEWRQDAWALRDTLILVSLHFRSCVQELAELAEIEGLEAPIWRIFANNVRRAGNEFLQKYMFTLQILEISSVKDSNISKNNLQSTKSSPSPTNNNQSIKTQIKSFLPTVLNEVFKITSSSECGILEFYDQEGLVVPLSTDHLNSQKSILQEQLSQLQTELNDKEMDNDKEVVLSRAIKDIRDELERIERKIKNETNNKKPI